MNNATSYGANWAGARPGFPTLLPPPCCARNTTPDATGNYCVPCGDTQRNHGLSQPLFIASGSAKPAKKESGNWFVCDLQICCHFTTQNRQTNLKTNGETNTFLVCLFVFFPQ